MDERMRRKEINEKEQIQLNDVKYVRKRSRIYLEITKVFRTKQRKRREKQNRKKMTNGIHASIKRRSLLSEAVTIRHTTFMQLQLDRPASSEHIEAILLRCECVIYDCVLGHISQNFYSSVTCINMKIASDVKLIHGCAEFQCINFLAILLNLA